MNEPLAGYTQYGTGIREYYGQPSLPEPVESEECVAVFHLYIDESGKLSGKSDYTSLCGYVAHATEWQRFATEWGHVRFKWQVPAIHMSRIMSPDLKDDGWKKKKQEWGDLWEIKRDDMLEEFGLLIQRANVICVGAVVDANAYRSVLKNPECLLFHQDSNVFVFQESMTRAIEVVETVDRHSPISIVIDDDSGTANAYYDTFNTLRNVPVGRLPKIKERIHGICFCNDVSYPGLQAADMISYESRREMIRQLEDSKPEISQQYVRLTHGGMYQPKFFSSEVLNRLGHNVKKAMEPSRVL